MIEFFSSIISTVGDIVEYIGNIWATISGVFSDIDFTVLYSWMPQDIQAVITALLVVLFLLALFGLVRRILFFLG